MISITKRMICCTLVCAFLLCSLISFAGCNKNDGSNNDVTDGATDDTTDGANEVPKELSYNVNEMHVSKGENDIYGKIYVPKSSEGKMPAVILSHSANLTADSMNAYAVGFAERGYVAYAFDFCGGSSKSRSDGNTEDMTLFTEVEDLKAVISEISSLEYVDADSIYLFGTSQGGLVTALTAEEVSDNIKGEILLYPAFNIPELASLSSGFDFSSLGNLFSFGGFGSYGKAFTDSLKDYNVYEHIGNFGGNVLIIHGSKDFIVKPSYSEQASGLYEHCTLKIIEGAGHGFNSENFTMYGDCDGTVWQYIDEYFAAE